jgi:transmembrane sensor
LREDVEGNVAWSGGEGMTGVDPAAGLNSLLREGIDWIARRRSDAFTPRDQTELRRWRALSPDHDAAYQEAAALGAVMREIGRELLDERMAATNVVPLRRPPAPQISRRTVLAGAMAASVAGVLIVGRPFGGSTPDFATTTGERRTLRLANGLTLELDAKTSIAVDESARNRIELIDGHAEIEARLAPAATMTLLAGKGMVSAHDARFDVRFDDGRACVTCLEGSLTVEHGERRLSLASRQQLVYTDDTVGDPVMIDPVEVVAWKNGQLIFHQTPLAEVVREVNRYREGKVMLASGSIGQRPVNGVFYTARIEDAIAQIEQITGARAHRLPGNIVVLS